MAALSTQHRSLKILIAEDDNVSRKLLSMLLKKLVGCEPDLVATADEASAKARNNDYDLIFMDYNMPGSSGADAVKMIRRDAELGKQPYIIGLSASFGDGHDLFLNAGIDEYISKPITLQRLKSVFSAGDDSFIGNVSALSNVES